MKNGKYASRNSKKVAVTVLALVLVLGCAIGGTIAWLTAQTDAVTNTFTVGNITMDLKEHELKADGTLGESEVTEINTYKIVPGATQPKDPFVTIKSGSEKCYVYVLVDNNLVIDTDVVGTYNINADGNVWETVATNGNKILYRYNTAVDAAAADQKLQVFTTVTYDGAKITKDNIDNLKDKTIVIDAFAHQSENITDVTVADAAAKAHFSMT